jgi:hypothetical protein
MADPERGIRTAEVWKRSFAPWANSADQLCREAADAA